MMQIPKKQVENVSAVLDRAYNLTRYDIQRISPMG